MELKVFPANRSVAREKVSNGSVLGVASSGNKTLVEYIPSSGGSSQIIIFQKEGLTIKTWHECPAQKSGYSKGCWHLGLAGWIYNLVSGHYYIELVGKPNMTLAEHDVSSIYGITSNFRNIRFDGEPTEPTEPTKLSTFKTNLLDKYFLPEPLLEKVEKFRKRQKSRLLKEQINRIPESNYIPQGRELVSAVSALMYDTWAPPLFMGPAGAGKSTLAEACAEILHLPLCRISGGIDLNAAYLLGEKTLSPVEAADNVLTAKIALACAKSGSKLTSEEVNTISEKLRTSTMQVVHEPGILLQAIQKGEMILVDEVNMVIPEVTSLLHSLLDWQRSITVPGIGEIKAHPDFRFVSAMNVGYMGTRPLNKAFRDRFRGIQVASITQETLQKLLEEKTDKKTAKKLSNIYQTIYDAVYSPSGATLSESCISLRALLRAAEEYSMKTGSLQEITVSCLTESIESENERTQLKDLIEMKIK